jgi:hypothetical protein
VRKRWVDIIVELGDSLFEMSLSSIACTQPVNPSGRDAADPGLLDHRNERLLGSLVRLPDPGDPAIELD